MPPLDRRSFLRTGAVASLGAGLLPLLPARAGAEAPRVKRSVRLGRTDLKVSDIGFGSSRLKGQDDAVRYALDQGITYFDTAESYTRGHSEETLGRALQGVRDKVVLASKVEAAHDADQASMMRSLEKSLRRLRTDWIDVYFNHAVNDPHRMYNPEWREFTLRATEAGKIRWRGMSGHGGRLVECLDYALDNDLVDVVLVGFHFGQDPAFHQRFTRKLDFVAIQTDLPRVLRKARKQDVGIVAMKTLRGAKLNDMRPFETGGASFAQAAFRWVFSSGLVDSLIVTMNKREQIDEYLAASGWTAPRAADLPLLLAYEERHGASQCRYGCNACTDTCSAAVPIAEVLRARMYAEDYGDPALGREAYAALGRPGAACAECPAPTCACPFGLPVATLTRRTNRLLG
jgi:predicted aldo/keto reductase-like oxidoreductase